MIWNYPSIALKVMELQKNQWKSREELESMQERKLLAQASNARCNVPHYRSLPDISSLEEISSLPLTRKEDLRNADRHISRLFQKEKLRQVPTSGSTGIPLTLYRTLDDNCYFSMLQCSRMLSTGVYPLSLRASIVYQRRNYFFWAPGVFRSLFVSMFEEEHRVLSMLKKGKPDILVSYPSMLSLLAHHNLESGIGFTAPRAISNAEILSKKARELISRSFNCSIRDVYGAVETGPIAFECEKGSMHVHSDSQIVEVLDKNGEPAKAGEEGEIAVTPLWPQAMPLIRYCLGDRVSMGRACTCGRGSHIIKGIKGRSAAYILMASGKPSTAVSLDIYVRYFPGVLLFQAVQDEPGRLTIKIVPQGRFPESSRQGLIRTLKAKFPEPMDISVEIVKSIPRTKTGKMCCFVSSLKSGFPT